MNNLKDYSYLEMAYGLAEKAKGWAGPNPYVGSVIVNRNVIVGYGYHERPGKPHAEVIALERAGKKAKGSTIYITLEPCVHWGRTPPCIGPVLEAKPKRVVISSLDPNPQVCHKGYLKLREAGVDVSVGILEEKNRVLNEAYNKFITRKTPFVTLKAAVSLDGRMATKTYDSRWITSSETREYGRLLRGEHDAVMVGVNTIIKDDPLLTVRHPLWEGKKVARVILDSKLRFPLRARMLSTLSRGKIIIFTLAGASRRKMEALEKKGAEIVALESKGPRVDLRDVLSQLGTREIAGVLVEGGSLVLTSMLEEKLADKIYLNFSPQLIGGAKAPSFFEGDGIRRLEDSLKLSKTVCLKVGEDIILEGYF